MSAVPIHVVDDDESFLRAVARFLRASGYSVQTHASAAEFLREREAGERGCVISDLRMPGMDGLEMQEALACAGHTMTVIFLTGNGDIPSTVSAIQQGAVDYIEKCAPKDKLLAAVQRALARESEEHGRRKKLSLVQSRLASLSEREREVLSEVVHGKMNKEIAAKLGIHERTVKLHRTAITTKLQVQSVAELTRLWLLARH
jgi:FixJ family two-component response regulator